MTKTFTERIHGAAGAPGLLRDGWTLTRSTVGSCARHRILGLAGEAAFFTLTSLPPVLLGLVGAIGYLTELVGADMLSAMRSTLDNAGSAVLSERAIHGVLDPVLDEVLASGRVGAISFGFALALWSGSTALNVYIDTISVVYGLAGRRPLVRQRLLSVLLYTAGLVTGIVLLPMLAIGPSVLAGLFPKTGLAVHLLYWPVIVLGSIGCLTALYSLSVPLRAPWREHVPGAALAVLVWLAGSLLLRAYLDVTIHHSPVYGALTAPMAVLWWLYVTAFAVLLGATVNSGLDELRPNRATAEARRANCSDTCT
ncbi:YihY/virulence factor BrkB family protein [Parasphingorhabdus pacifica]